MVPWTNRTNYIVARSVLLDMSSHLYGSTGVNLALIDQLSIPDGSTFGVMLSCGHNKYTSFSFIDSLDELTFQNQLMSIMLVMPT